MAISCLFIIALEWSVYSWNLVFALKVEKLNVLIFVERSKESGIFQIKVRRMEWLAYSVHEKKKQDSFSLFGFKLFRFTHEYMVLPHLRILTSSPHMMYHLQHCDKHIPPIICISIKLKTASILNIDHYPPNLQLAQSRWRDRRTWHEWDHLLSLYDLFLREKHDMFSS